MSTPSDRSFGADFKRFFVRGLVILLPSVLTLWIVVKAYEFVHTNIAVPINTSIQVGMEHAARVWPTIAEWDVIEPSSEEITAERNERGPRSGDQTEDLSIQSTIRVRKIQAWWSSRWYMELIGLFVAIVAVYIAGRLLGGFLGRRFYRKLEGLLTSVPVVKQVYPYIKQIVDFLFADERPIDFNRVVAVEYPRKGVWSVGFLTGSTLRTIEEAAPKSVTVFVPSSPTPFTGYTVTVPRSETIDLPITVEEAIRFAVSGGVLVPEHQRVMKIPGAVGDAPDSSSTEEENTSATDE
jgi:uncharacterized membrane protein